MKETFRRTLGTRRTVKITGDKQPRPHIAPRGSASPLSTLIRSHITPHLSTSASYIKQLSRCSQVIFCSDGNYLKVPAPAEVLFLHAKISKIIVVVADDFSGRIWREPPFSQPVAVSQFNAKILLEIHSTHSTVTVSAEQLGD